MPVAKRTTRGSGGAKKMVAPPQRPKNPLPGGLTGSATLGGALPGGMRRLPPQMPSNITGMGAFGGAMAPGGQWEPLGGMTASAGLGAPGALLGGMQRLPPGLGAVTPRRRRGQAPVFPPSPGQEYGNQ